MSDIILRFPSLQVYKSKRQEYLPSQLLIGSWRKRIVCCQRSVLEALL
jgi:hypothetical protein